MPRTFDRRTPVNDKDPTRNELDWDNPGGMIQGAAEGAGDLIHRITSGIGKLFNLPTPTELLEGIAAGVSGVWDAATEIFIKPLNKFASLVGGLLDSIHIPILDPTKILNLPGLFTKAQSTINAIVGGLTGLFGIDWDGPDVESAAEALARQAAETAASVAILQQLNSSNAQGGNSGFVDFSGVADASSMGSSFTQTYSGAGTDTLGVVGGRTGVVPGTFTADRLCRFVFNVKNTLTDYQRVSMVYATSPGKRSFGFPATQTVYGYNYLCARVATTGTYTGVDCVQAILDIDSFDLGCVVSGVWTKWVTVSHKFRPGAIYSLDAGSAGGIRQYKVLVNGAPVHTHNEVGTSSQLGSNYRATGGSGAWEAGTDGGTWFRAQPSAIAAFYMADNSPPASLSSIGRAFRASTSLVNFNTAGTEYTLPANMFDTFDYATSDLTWNGSAGSWTVGRRGNYIVNAHMANNNTTLTGYVVLYVNGVTTTSGNVGPFSTVAFAMPLSVGDVLTLRYYTGTSNCRIMGAPEGDITFFQVVRITPDNLEDISA